MKKSTTILLIIFLLSSSNFLSQTWNNRGDNKLVVIAASGLNLRTDAKLNSKTLVKVAYGEKVILLSKDNSDASLDTLNKNEKSPIMGKWVSVSFQNHKGYMFDAFLASVKNVEFKAITKDDYALLFPGCNCIYNFYNLEGKVWNGIYENSNGDYFVNIAIPSYHRQAGAIEEDICITTPKMNNLKFIIGSKTNNISVKEGKYFGMFPGNFIDNSFAIDENNFFERDNNNLVYCCQGVEYPLNHKDYYPHGVEWMGDLNGDKIEDLIIQYGSKTGEIVLYLSDDKNKQEPFRKAASYRIGYCC